MSPKCCKKKSCGRSCPTGPTGAASAVTGPTGPIQLLINQTQFVDLVYGNNGTAQPDDEAHPYQTIALALSTANVGDTIYLQPGTYTENNIALRDGINFYMTEGVLFNSVGSPIFTDASGPVSVVITGFGDFSSDSGILSLTNGSAVSFSGNNLTTTGGTYMFQTVGASRNTITLEFQSVNTVDATIFSLTGQTLLTADIVKIDSFGAILDVADTASGSAVINAERALTGAENVFILESNQFTTSVSINTITSMTAYLISVNVPTVIDTSDFPLSTSAFEFQTMNIIGGIVLAVGDPAFITFPTDFNIQPAIFLRSQSIYVSSSDNPMFNVSYCGLHVEAGALIHSVGAPYAIVLVSGLIEITSQLTSFSNNSISTGFAQIGPLSVFTLLGHLLANQGTILDSGTGATALFKLSLLFNSSPSGAVTSFRSRGNTSLDISENFIINTADFLVSGNHIEVLEGLFSVLFNNILYTGGNSNFVFGALNTSVNFLGSMFSSNANNSIVYNILGNLDVTCTFIMCNGSSLLLLDTDDGSTATANILVSNVTINGNGYLITSNNGIPNCEINTIIVNGGYVLSTTGNNNSYIVFNDIQCNGGGSTNAFLLLSSGTTWIEGSVINMNNYTDPFAIGNVDGIGHMRIDVQDIIISTATTAFSVFGDLYVKSSNLSSNNMAGDLFSTETNSTLRIDILNINNNTNELNSACFRTNGTFSGYIGDLSTNNAIFIQEDGAFGIIYDSLNCASNIDTLPVAISFSSPGNVDATLKGGKIALSLCSIGIACNVGTNVYMESNLINFFNVNDGWMIDNPSFTAYVDCGFLVAGNVGATNSIVSVQGGFLHYKGSSISVGTPTQVFQILDPGNFTGVVDYLIANNTIFAINTDGTVRYNTKSTSTNAGPIMTITWPTGGSVHEFSGYMTTQGTDVIVIQGTAVGTLRTTTNSILANPGGGLSINNTTGINMNVIADGVTTTNVVSANVIFFPATALVVDLGVF